MHKAWPAEIISVGLPSGPQTSRIASPGSKRHQFPRALADGLDDQRDKPRYRIGVRDGQRNAFGAGGAMNNDELAGQADFRHAPRLDIQPRHIRAELLFRYDSIAYINTVL